MGDVESVRLTRQLLQEQIQEGTMLISLQKDMDVSGTNMILGMSEDRGLTPKQTASPGNTMINYGIGFPNLQTNCPFGESFSP